MINMIKLLSTPFFLIILFANQLAFAQAPIINSFSPISAEPGNNVIISGSNFNSTPANNTVYFGGTKATVTSASPTSLNVTVPMGATHSLISVSTSAGVALSNTTFIPTFSFCGSPNVNSNSWNPAVTFNNNGTKMAIADIDGDGFNDIVTASAGGNDSLWILRNQTSVGTINSSSFSKKGFYVGGSAGFIKIADIDADGKKDIIVDNGGFGTTWTFRIFRNTSTPGIINSSSLSAPITFTLTATVGYPKGIEVGDIDGDGRLEILMRDPNVNFNFLVMRNTSTPGVINNSSFATEVSYVATGTAGISDYGIAVADVDKDGKADVIWSMSGNVNVLRSTSTVGSISFAPPQSYTCNGSQTWAHVADFNNDGKIDIIQHSFTGTFRILQNNITSPGPLNATSFGNEVVFNGDYGAISDMDGDGRPDILNGSNVYRNNNIGGNIAGTDFNSTIVLNNGMYTSIGYSDFGDLDNDSKPEIIRYNNSNVEVFKYSGALSVPTPDICMVTVDSLSVNNEIYWDKTLYPTLDTMIIWRETTSNIYKRIGAVHNSALSMFIDTARSIGPANGDPNIGTYRYKIQIRDTCGNLSPMSKWHNTVFFINSAGTFFWNQYLIEGPPSVNPMTQFDLVRDDFAPTGIYNTVGSVAGTQTTLNDPFYVVYQNTADWRVFAYGLNCVPTQRINPDGSIQSAIVKSRSNIKNNRTTGIHTNTTLDGINVYPNPNNGTLFVELKNQSNANIEIHNSLGEVVYKNNLSANTNALDISELKPGVYFCEIKTENGRSNYKIVKE